MKFILKLAYETAKAKCFLGTLLQYELFPEKSWLSFIKKCWNQIQTIPKVTEAA